MTSLITSKTIDKRLGLKKVFIRRPAFAFGDNSAPAPVPPTNITAPTVSGTTSLTGTPGTWSGDPDLTYQWLRDGTAIAGATLATYNTTPADEGHLLSFRVSASVQGVPDPVIATSNPTVVPYSSLLDSITVSLDFDTITLDAA